MAPARLLLFTLAIAPLLSTRSRAQDDSPTLRVTSRLVEISVIAQDKQGNPVRDLTRDDFILTDNKHRARIAVFTIDETGISSGVGNARSAKADPLIIDNRELRPAEKSTPLTVILFDGLNIDTLDAFQYGKRELLKFLNTLHSGDPVALYSINGPQVRVIHDFTGDPASLIEAARKVSGVPLLNDSGPSLTPVSSAGLGGGVFERLGEFVEEKSRADEAALRQVKTLWTLAALEDVARHLSYIPGRKNLIWISNGFPITIGLSPGDFKSADGKGANQELFLNSEREKNLGRLFTEAQVTIYPIDPAGLAVDSIYAASISGRQAHGMLQKQQSDGRMITAGELSAPGHTTMRLIAEQTGGLAFYDANDLAGSVRRAMDDASFSYMLGFYPPADSWDGKYHSLRVTVNRPGVRIRARRGYLAQSIATSEPERQEALKLAVASPLEGVAVGVKVNVPTSPLESGPQQLSVTIDPRDILFEPRDGRMRAGVDLVFAQQTSDGRIVKGENKTLQLDLTAKSYSDGVANWLSFQNRIDIDANASRVRIVVRDSATGAVGSVSVPVRHFPR